MGVTKSAKLRRDFYVIIALLFVHQFVETVKTKGQKNVMTRIVKTRMDAVLSAKLRMDSHVQKAILQFATLVKNQLKRLNMLKVLKQQLP